MSAQRTCTSPLQLFERVQQHLSQFDAGTQRLHQLKSLRRTLDAWYRPLLKPDQSGQNLCLSGPLRQLAAAFGNVLLGSNALGGVNVFFKPGLLQTRQSLGITEWDTAIARWTIRIEQRPETDAMSQQTFLNRADGIFSTLLHEVMHALFRLEACDGQCGRERCRKVFNEQLGSQGHGDAWLRMAAVVERFVRGHLLWDVDLWVKKQAQTHFVDESWTLLEGTEEICWPYETLSYEVDENGSVRLTWESR